MLRQLKVILSSSKCLHMNLWRSPRKQCKCAVSTTAFMLTWFLPSTNRTRLTIPNCYWGKKPGKDTASVWVLVKLNQTFGFTLGCAGSTLLCTNKIMMQKCQHNTVPAEPALHGSASGFWRTNTAGQGDSAGLSNVTSLTVSPVTDNCVLTQMEFLHSLPKTGLWIVQTLCQPLRGSVWRRALSLTQGVHSLGIPTSKAGITTLSLFTDVQLDLWHLYWAQEPTLTSALMLLHRLGLSDFHIGELQQPATIFRSRFTWFMFLSYTCIFCRLSSQNQHIYLEVVIAVKSCTWWDNLYRFLSPYTTEQ